MSAKEKPPGTFSLLELPRVLDDCGMSIQIHHDSWMWVVWLYRPDRPGALCRGAHSELAQAIAQAVAEWKGDDEEEEEEEEEAPVR